jgi:hypothetical protein
MNAEEMKRRTKLFALGTITLAEELPDTPTARIIRGQLIRSGTKIFNPQSAIRNNYEVTSKNSIFLR